MEMNDGYISYISRGLSFDNITTIALIDSTSVSEIPQVPGQETPAIHYSTTKDLTNNSFVFDFTHSSLAIQFNTIAVYASSGLVCYAMSNFYMFDRSIIMVRPEIDIREHVIDLKISGIHYDTHVEQVFETVHARIIDRVIEKYSFKDLLKFNKNYGYQYTKEYLGYEVKTTLDRNKLYYNDYFKHIHRDLNKLSSQIDSTYLFYFNSIVKILDENITDNLTFFDINDGTVDMDGNLFMKPNSATIYEDGVKINEKYYISVTKEQYNEALYKASTYINNYSQGIIVPIESRYLYIIIDYQYDIMQYKIYMLNLANYIVENVIYLPNHSIDEFGVVEIDKSIENYIVDLSDISEEVSYSISTHFRPRVSRLDNRFLVMISNKVLIDFDINNSVVINHIDNNNYELGIDKIYDLKDMNTEIPIVDIETTIPSYSYTPQYDDYQVEVRKVEINAYLRSDGAQYIDLPLTSIGGIILNRAALQNELSNSLIYNEQTYKNYINKLLNPIVITTSGTVVIADEANYGETLTDRKITFDTQSSAEYIETQYEKKIIFPSINDNFYEIMEKLYKTFGSQYVNTNDFIYYLDRYNTTKTYPFNTLPEYYLNKNFSIDSTYQLLPYKTFTQITSLDEQTLRDYQYFKYLGSEYTYINDKDIENPNGIVLKTDNFYKISWDSRSTLLHRYYFVSDANNETNVTYQRTFEYQLQYYNLLLNELLYVKYRNKSYIEFKIFDSGIIILEDIGDNILISVYSNSLNTTNIKIPIKKTMEFNVDMQNLQLIVNYKLDNTWKQLVVKMDNYIDGDKQIILQDENCLLDYSGTNVKIGDLLL